MHRLDVERLLAEPAGRIALLGVGEVLGRDLRELAGRERGVAVPGGVGAGVGLDRRRGVGVDDADGHAGAGVLRAALIGAAQLRGLIAARRVRQRGAVEGRQRRLEVRLVLGRGRAVGGRARARVHERRRGWKRLLQRLHHPFGGREAAHGEHVGGDRVGNGRRRGRRLERVGALREVVQRDRERGLGGGRRPARGDVAAGRLDPRHLEALGLQPLLDGLDRRVGRRVLRPELVRGEVLPERRAARRRDRVDRGLQRVLAAVGREIDPQRLRRGLRRRPVVGRVAHHLRARGRDRLAPRRRGQSGWSHGEAGRDERGQSRSFSHYYLPARWIAPNVEPADEGTP